MIISKLSTVKLLTVLAAEVHSVVVIISRQKAQLNVDNNMLICCGVGEAVEFWVLAVHV